jgi:NADP-dependent 3-hydroxy acid dehydrogenase YdfG
VVTGPAVVTGATGGIGRAVVNALSRGGATVWAVGRDSVRLDALETSADVGKVVPLRADLQDDRELESAASSILRATETLDVLVHAAGIIRLATCEETTADDLDAQYRVNFRAPYLLTKALLPALRRAGGQIAFVNSSSVLRPAPGNTSYTASKAALKAYADGLRDEVNGDGIRVVTVYAGRTATPMQASIHALEDRPYDPHRLLQPEDVADVLLSALALPSSAEVVDVHVRPKVKPQDRR